LASLEDPSASGRLPHPRGETRHLFAVARFDGAREGGDPFTGFALTSGYWDEAEAHAKAETLNGSSADGVQYAVLVARVRDGERAQSAASGPIVVQPGEGDALTPAGPVIKAPSELSGGAFTVVEARLEPGTDGPPMHLHRSHDESFYVVEGTVTAITDGSEHQIGPGGYVFFPRGTPHTLANRGDAPVRYLAIGSSGLDRFARELREAEDDDARRAVLDRWETETV
jgi:quercetin dioxygenase-like cupin family protein